MFVHAAMRLGSQQNGDHDEPAVKVAVTRYLSQSQNAFGNPEITWYSNNFFTSILVSSCFYELKFLFLSLIEALRR